MRTPYCQECGATEKLQDHHIIPRSKGGPDDFTNIETLCVECHSKKHSKDLTNGPVKNSNENLNKFHKLKDQFIKLYKEGYRYKDIAKKFDVTISTLFKWRNKLGLEKRRENGIRGKKLYGVKHSSVNSERHPPVNSEENPAGVGLDPNGNKYTRIAYNY